MARATAPELTACVGRRCIPCLDPVRNADPPDSHPPFPFLRCLRVDPLPPSSPLLRETNDASKTDVARRASWRSH